jgi:uncharacterized protein
MAGLYFSSTQAYSGKSAMCIALGLLLKNQGLSVAYMKPLGGMPVEVGGRLVDEDALFISRLLQIDDPADALSPALLIQDVYDALLRGESPPIEEQIRSAYSRLAADHDVVLLEGTALISGGFSLGLSAGTIVEMLDAKGIHVLTYRPDLALDNVMLAKSLLGDRLIGVIVNNVPPDAMERVRSEFAQFLGRNGMKMFGAIPQDKLLTAISVSELAQLLDGEILCCYRDESDLVEAFQVGAMNVDSALRYMMRVPNKAVITGGDRADIQLAALQTSTKALVLTGNLYPDANILSRASEAGVPVILVRTDTMTTVNLVEQALGRIRLTHPRQVARLLDLVSQSVDIPALREAAGI